MPSKLNCLKTLISLLLTTAFARPSLAGCEDITSIMASLERPTQGWTWRTRPDSNREYRILLTYFRVPGTAAMGVIQASRHVGQVLMNTEGLVGFSLHGKLESGEFWTLSVWENDASIDAFVSNTQNAHGQAMQNFRGVFFETRFERWNAVVPADTITWTPLLDRK